MTELLTAMSAGAGNGAIYALIAIGFVIIYKATQVVSFAQPALMLAGVILVSHLSPRVGFLAAGVLGTLSIALVAVVLERICVRPMVGKATFTIAIITIGIDIVVRVVAGAFVGVNPRVIGDPWGQDAISVGGIRIAERHLAALVATAVVVVLLFAFFRFTATGLAMRAAALDQEAAVAQGVSVGAVFALSWALAGALAAVAGIFAAAGNAVDQNLWLVALTALPVIILGGLDSIGGAVIGGLVIGAVQAVVANYHSAWFPTISTNVGQIAPYLVMMLVLLVRPHGLFGTKEVRRV